MQQKFDSRVEDKETFFESMNIVRESMNNVSTRKPLAEMLKNTKPS